MRYKNKPKVIEAVQFKGLEINKFEVVEFCKGHQFVVGFDHDADRLCIETLEGDMWASKGDYIIKGIKGEFYPCKPDIFEASYEEI